MISFDFHFHLLTKHAISAGADLNKTLDVRGLGDMLNVIFGGPFESQSAPVQVLKSPLYFGVNSINAVERAFVENMLKFPGYKLEKNLPLDGKMIWEIKEGMVSYYELFRRQLDYSLNALAKNPKWNIHLLTRNAGGETTNKNAQALQDIEAAINDPAAYRKGGGRRWMALSIEGGHNLAEVLIGSKVPHATPELTLKRLQDDPQADFLCMNLCHLTDIPEQRLGGFAQGLNKSAQRAFQSDDFLPYGGKVGNTSVGLTAGLTIPGEKVVRQALTHPAKPIVIDVKHMSLYTRLKYYEYREMLAEEVPMVENIPIISSHTGFTFITCDEYLRKKDSYMHSGQILKDGRPQRWVKPRQRWIGRTANKLFHDIHCNPWTVNLFDEEIEIIMRSNGLIGLSLDQRVLGTQKMMFDDQRGEWYEEEYVIPDEFERLYQNLDIPTEESLLTKPFEKLFNIGRPERHGVLLALHIVHAVKVGKAAGIADPWSHICVGSDFDGLINPVNIVENVGDMEKLRDALLKYMPQADRSHAFYEGFRALTYKPNGEVDRRSLEENVEKFMLKNGLRFLRRFLRNWQAE